MGIASKVSFFLLVFVLSMAIPHSPGVAAVSSTRLTFNLYDPTYEELIYPGETTGLRAVYYNGRALPDYAGYVWTSSDSSILSIDFTNRLVTAQRTGDVTMTVTYLGDTASATYHVRRPTGFKYPPSSTGIPAIASIFPGLTIQLSAKGLETTDDFAPLPNVPVTIYDGSLGGSDICTATSNKSGDSACSLLVFRTWSRLCERYSGNAELAPVHWCTSN